MVPKEACWDMYSTRPDFDQAQADMLKTGAVFFFLSQIPDSLQYLGQAKHDYGLDRAAEIS